LNDDQDLGEVVALALNMLPDEMTADEVAALVLTMINGYLGDKSMIGVGVLLSAAVTFAQEKGYQNDNIARLLVATAAMLIDRNDGDTLH
jgi:hypothetical protein